MQKIKRASVAGAVAIMLSMAVGAVQATTITSEDSFGTIGSTSDQSTDVTETLGVDLFGSTSGAGNTLTNVKVEVLGSMSTEGTATNNGTEADVNAVVLAAGGNWQATTSFISGADKIFAADGSRIIDEDLGTVVEDETVNFGIFTNNSGWLTVFDGLNSIFDATGTMDYLFETHTASFILGSSNFSSAFTTATAGGLRVTYTYGDTPTVPEPATLALMGLGLAGIGYRRRQGKKA